LIAHDRRGAPRTLVWLTPVEAISSTQQRRSRLEWSNCMPSHTVLARLTSLLVLMLFAACGQAEPAEGSAAGDDGTSAATRLERPVGHLKGPVPGIPDPGDSDEKLDGLFMQLSYSFGNLYKIWYFFTPAGYVYLNNIPPGGLEFFDFAKAAQEEPDNVGSYVVQGEKLIITKADGEVDELEFGHDEDDPENLEIDGLFASKADKFKPGETFEGTYQGGASVGGGAVMSTQTYEFSKDGTYKWSAIGTVSMTTSESHVSAGSTGEAQGTYKVIGEGNTIELTPAGGETVRYTLFPFENLDGEIELVINGGFYGPLEPAAESSE